MFKVWCRESVCSRYGVGSLCVGCMLVIGNMKMCFLYRYHAIKNFLGMGCVVCLVMCR